MIIDCFYQFQFTKYSPRPLEEEINIGENLGEVAFAFYNHNEKMPKKPDPSYLTFNIMISEFSQNFTVVPVQEAELETINADKHPRFFHEGSYPSKITELLDGADPEIYTLKDPDKFKISGYRAAVGSRFLVLEIRKCNNATSKVPCAPFGEDNELF